MPFSPAARDGSNGSAAGTPVAAGGLFTHAKDDRAATLQRLLESLEEEGRSELALLATAARANRGAAAAVACEVSPAAPPSRLGVRELLQDVPLSFRCALDGNLLVDPIRSPNGEVFE